MDIDEEDYALFDTLHQSYFSIPVEVLHRVGQVENPMVSTNTQVIEQSNARLKKDAAFTNRMQVYKLLICIRSVQGLNNLRKNHEEGADQISSST